MNLHLENRTALVTGSTAGIGFAIARTLAAEGAHVIVNGRSQERVDAAIAAIRADLPDSRLTGQVADLASAQGCAELAARLPVVDILVNNVGIFEPKAFADIPDEDWQRLFEVNVFSGIRLSRACLPGMKARDWGRIIFISSESALQIPVEMIHYGVTKTAQIAVARGIAEDCSGTGVTANSILVGPTASEGVGTFVATLASQRGQSAGDFEKEFFSTMRPGSLLKRFIQPEEIASLVAFVASPAAAAINGAALRADGGVIRAAV